MRGWEGTKRRIKVVAVDRAVTRRSRLSASESLSNPKKSYRTVTTAQGRVVVVHSLPWRLAASPSPGFQERSKGLWQIYVSAGSQLATQTLLLEPDRTWRLTGRATKHTLPVTADAGCSGE